MKVAHITTVHPGNDNRIFYKECKSLKDAGYDVIFIVAGESDTIVDGIPIVGLPKKKNRFKRLIFTSFIQLIDVCNKVNADIYHFHDPEIIFAGLYLKLKGKRVIYDIHEDYPSAILGKKYIKTKYLRYILSATYDIFEKFVVNFFDGIVTARPDISNRFSHRNLVTVRNFPAIENLRKSKYNSIDIKKDKPSVIYVGLMSFERGIGNLIEAFTYIPHIELWLLGPVSDNSLMKLIQGTQNVRYLGIVQPYEVFSYIDKADIGIITFLPLPNHLTTLATKPFEYMACGKPIVMSNFKYWQEFFQDAALYVDPYNPRDIANKILYLLNNKSLMQQMGNRNKELAISKYSWEAEVSNLLSLYAALQ